jgi:hypothetical protein
MICKGLNLVEMKKKIDINKKESLLNHLLVLDMGYNMHKISSKKQR